MLEDFKICPYYIGYLHVCCDIKGLTVNKKPITYTGLGRPLGLQEIEAVWIPRQLVQEVGKVFRLTHRSLLPPGDIPGTHLC